MIWWNFYFIAKTLLHFKNYIHAGFLWNFLLLVAVLLPLPEKLPRAVLIRRLRSAIAAILAIALFWSETWLPPAGAVWKFFADPATRPSAGYVWQFLLSSLNPWLFAAMGLTLAAVWMAEKRRIRLAPLDFILLGIIGVTGLHGSVSNIDRFYETESKREVRLDKGSGKPDFDIVLIQICSLSWDDLAHSKFDARPFLSKFDYLFTNFNSATSYSNPAAIRLLSAPCGQRSHDAIFREEPQNCYLMEDLKQLGYRTYTLLNHDGKYDGFMEKLIKTAKVDPMFPIQLQPQKLSFDDTPIYSDKETLGLWLKAAQAQNSPAAVYYNTISLHGGGHMSKSVVKNPWAMDRTERYNNFLGTLITELDGFFSDLEASGRKAVVIFVPEHGAALVGTRLQAPDLRDIPFPQITLVPMGIKFFGPGYNGLPVRQEQIDKPVSYLALARTLSDLMKKSPYSDRAASVKAVLSDIPETPLVSESENAIVMRGALGFIYKPRGGKWTDLPADISPEFTGKRYMTEGPVVKN